MTRPALSVILATHTEEGIMRVERMCLPHVDGVEYVVSWQDHQEADIPIALKTRNDVRVFRCQMHGISNNRNNALSHANGEICLNADDDLTYTASQLRAVISVFKNDPSLDFALFRYDGSFKKKYPSECVSIHALPKGYSVTTFEIAFRRKASSEHPRLRFNTHFGPGAPILTAGEDEAFLMAAKRLGLNGKFFPITITSHPNLPTGRRVITDNGVLRTTGALISLTHALSFPLRIPVNALRIKRAGRAGFWQSLYHMMYGALYALSRPEVRKSVRLKVDKTNL